MRIVRLVHWNDAEAAERAERLNALGFDCEHNMPSAPEILREARQRPPEVFVIDLSRLPSHGREMGLALRESKATRQVPLVFVDGLPEKVERVRSALPDAAFTTWSRIGPALKRAIARPPARPVVPSSRMDGYSGTPLPKKLGIKPSSCVALIGAPEGFENTLGPLPQGVSLRRRAATADLVLWFTRSRADLERRVAKVAALAGAGALWIMWPKRTSGVKTDLSESVVREVGLASGLVDYKICAVDATWSGLRFARRKPLPR